MQTQTFAPPAGFAAHDRKSPLTDPREPLYSRKAPDAMVLGLRAPARRTPTAAASCTAVPIASLADDAMGL